MYNKITDQQELFAKYYCETGNKRKAAIMAGYSESTAPQIGSNLYRDKNVKKRINELQADLADTIGVTVVKIANEWKNIAFSDVSDVFDLFEKTEVGTDENGRVTRTKQLVMSFNEGRSLKDLPEKVRKTIESIEETKDGIKVKFHSKANALKELSKLCGFDSVQKLELTASKSIADLINRI